MAANVLDSVAIPFDSSDVLHILCQVLSVSVDLHPQDEDGATPFDYLCCGTHSSKGKDPSYRSPLAVSSWLQGLFSAGIGVHAYIKEEHDLHPMGTLIHCRQVRLGLVRRFHVREEADRGRVFLSVWDELDKSAEYQVPGSWPEIDGDDVREAVYHEELVTKWAPSFDLLGAISGSQSHARCSEHSKRSMVPVDHHTTGPL